MKIVHFSDSHLGVTTHGTVDPDTGINTRVLDFFNSLCQVVDFVDHKKPDIALFSGDAFHRPNPNPQLINMFSEIVEGITYTCPIVIIPGNHDQTVNPRDSAVSVFQPYDNVHCDDQTVTHIIDTKGGRIVIDALPYPRSYVDHVGRRIDWSGSDFDAKLMVGHFSIQGCIYGYEKQLWLSMDAPITLDHISSSYDYVAMGHIHLRQQMGKRHIWYAGSTDRIDFGEETEQKGFNYVEIINGQTDVEFIPLNVRPMQTFRYDLTDVTSQHTTALLRQLEQDAIDPENAIVRIEVDVTDYCLDKQRIHQATNFHNLVSIKETPKKRSTSRIAGDVFQLNEYELLDEYFHLHQYADADIDVMLDLFEEVMKDEQRN